MIERGAKENFRCFDLNQDGLSSLEEANVLNSTIEEFKKIHQDNDGFIHPAEYDTSLS